MRRRSTHAPRRFAPLLALTGCILVEKGAFDTAAPTSSPTAPTTRPAGDSAAAEPSPGPGPVSLQPLQLQFEEGALRIISVPPMPGGLVGLAETRGACLSAGACWRGEDCRSSWTGADGAPQPPICRALGADGALTLEAGVGLAAVDADSTLFRAGAAATITWTLTAPDGGCTAGGADPAAFPDCAPSP